MFELFLYKRLSQLHSDGFVINAKETVFELDTRGHHIEGVRDAHCCLNASIMMMISKVAK
jgi:hypothetical protein